MDFLIAFSPSHAIVIDPSRMLNFRLISSTIYTILNIHASSLIYASWYLACPGEVQMTVIRCLAYSEPSIISATVSQFYL